MNKNFRMVKSTTMIALILLSVLASFCFMLTAPAMAQEGEETTEGKKFISYNSILNVQVDQTPLRDPLAIDSVTAVPVDVTYKTTLPDIIEKMAGRFLLFGSFILIPPQVKYEVVESKSTVTDWADVTFDSPAVLPDTIPSQSQEATSLPTVNLLISPRREAPAVPQTITIRVSIAGMGNGRLKGYSIDTNIKFEPAYVPEIEVYVQEPTRFSGPRESMEFKCLLKNKANKATTVLIDISDVNSEWAPTMNPSKITLPANGQETVTFSVVSPYSFGWHDETVAMNLKFTPYPAPISSTTNYNTSMGQVVEAQIRVENRGFSFSGFEFVFLGLIIILIAVIVLKMKSKK